MFDAVTERASGAHGGALSIDTGTYLACWDGIVPC